MGCGDDAFVDRPCFGLLGAGLNGLVIAGLVGESKFERTLKFFQFRRYVKIYVETRLPSDMEMNAVDMNGPNKNH